ncbi:HYC_CC_PP family protein [Croceimicrobium hydrocarbonivorans]|uniref:Uncharacterized protein n=1 Tax=Croceimicrobium hydrocarbonivorans TaxID=2761580 RepID=A0A7H0VCI4_9FLAO|nr:hypothetical protein [Croceimicrobium hydrocarbonivorans]QNR23432.1 hypothetical protein H4K34_13745 [Croceimicrobium hydrocarbonivorans]
MKKWLAIVMLFSLFLSITGIDIGVHSCGGEIHSLAFYQKAEACEHVKPKIEEPKDCCSKEGHCKRKAKPSESKEEKGKCCDDELIDLEILEVELIQSSQDFVFQSDQTIHSSDSFELSIPLHSHQQKDPHYYQYKPPLIRVQHIIDYQVFLI